VLLCVLLEILRQVKHKDRNCKLKEKVRAHRKVLPKNKKKKIIIENKYFFPFELERLPERGGGSPAPPPRGPARGGEAGKMFIPYWSCWNNIRQ
jgi:hypothetical protein